MVRPHFNTCKLWKLLWCGILYVHPYTQQLHLEAFPISSIPNPSIFQQPRISSLNRPRSSSWQSKKNFSLDDGICVDIPSRQDVPNRDPSGVTEVGIRDHDRRPNLISQSRRNLIVSSMASTLLISPKVTWAEESNLSALVATAATDTESSIQEKVLVVLTGEAKQLFNEGRAKEMQGNYPASYRIYSKVTNLVPRFIYGWSNLGNVQVVLGKLTDAEVSYSKAVDLCNTNLEEVGDQFGVRRCDDLYVLYLNRGCLRLNNNMKKEALKDLELSATLRGKPDAVILQNRARARELNGMYRLADRDYDVAISMTSNEVAPFWLRAALVKFELGDTIGALDLVRRVEVKFPEAPEVRAALAAMLSKKGDQAGAQRKFLEIPDRQRLNFGNSNYLQGTVAWPPIMIETIQNVARSVGDPS